MKKTIVFITIGLTTMLSASTYNQPDRGQNVVQKRATKAVQKQHKVTTKRQVKKVVKRRKQVTRKPRYHKRDRNLKQRHTLKRNFRSHNEFKRMKHQHRYLNRGIPHKKIHAYKHYRKAWYRDYLHNRSPFYDLHGYYYGYFNEFGYFFEGLFYRYDRHYTYRDRLRGRGLFDHYYYRPYRQHSREQERR